MPSRDNKATTCFKINSHLTSFGRPLASAEANDIQQCLSPRWAEPTNVLSSRKRKYEIEKALTYGGTHQ